MARDLRTEFDALPPDHKKEVHYALCTLALAAWQKFATASGTLTYRDSVVGLTHVLDWQLPADAFKAAFEAPDEPVSAALAQRYREPIVALQDLDLEFPDRMQFVYYALYNAFRKYAAGEPIDDWLIVNQALAALPTTRGVWTVLEAALALAAGHEATRTHGDS
jgi:hypothetical protein